MNLKVELIKLAIQAITLVIAGFLAPAVLSWLNEKSEDARLSRMKDWALKAVKAAEQIYKDYEIRDPDGENRKKAALRILRRANYRCKLGLTDEDLEALLQAAVHDINAVGVECWADLPEIEDKGV